MRKVPTISAASRRRWAVDRNCYWNDPWTRHRRGWWCMLKPLSAATRLGRVRAGPAPGTHPDEGDHRFGLGAVFAGAVGNGEGERWPRPSQARWIFLASPPRERPRAWSCGLPAGPLLTGPGRVLVGVHDRRVDGDDPAQVALGIRLFQERGEHALPGPVCNRLWTPSIDRTPGRRHPRRPRTALPRDRVDHLPVITPPPTPPR